MKNESVQGITLDAFILPSEISEYVTLKLVTCVDDVEIAECDDVDNGCFVFHFEFSFH